MANPTEDLARKLVKDVTQARGMGIDVLSVLEQAGIPVEAGALPSTADTADAVRIRAEQEVAKNLAQASTVENVMRSQEVVNSAKARAEALLSQERIVREISNQTGRSPIDVTRDLDELENLLSQANSGTLMGRTKMERRTGALRALLGDHPDVQSRVGKIEAARNTAADAQLQKMVDQAAKNVGIQPGQVSDELRAQIRSEILEGKTPGVKNLTERLRGEMAVKQDLAGTNRGIVGQMSSKLQNIAGKLDLEEAAELYRTNKLTEAGLKQAAGLAKKAQFARGTKIAGVAGGATALLALLASIFRDDPQGNTITPQQMFLLQQQQKSAQEQALADALIQSRLASAELKGAQAQTERDQSGMDAILKQLQIRQLQNSMSGGGF